MEEAKSDREKEEAESVKERTGFKAFDGRGGLLSHTWATTGTIAERNEIEMYQSLLNQGHYTYVEIFEPDGAKVPAKTIYKNN